VLRSAPLAHGLHDFGRGIRRDNREIPFRVRQQSLAAHGGLRASDDAQALVGGLPLYAIRLAGDQAQGRTGSRSGGRVAHVFRQRGHWPADPNRPHAELPATRRVVDFAFPEQDGLEVDPAGGSGSHCQIIV